MKLDIVFFKKGSVLIEQGERNPGIFYVIDGFLDVNMDVGEVKTGKTNLYSNNNILVTCSVTIENRKFCKFCKEAFGFKDKHQKGG